MKRLAPNRMNSHGADYVRAYHHVVVTPDVTLKDLLTPGFWAAHVNNVKVGDLLDVIAEDMSMDVQLRVVSKGIGFVEMRARMAYEAPDRKRQSEKDESPLPEVPDNYKVQHTPKAGWIARTIDPSETVSKDHKTQREAIHAAIEHARKVAGVAA